ncbi:hypothetical protein KM043_001865 [Ampulex compressa]|nr:hypothetical protein KM043_001865 [Ampulex compressa]
MCRTGCPNASVTPLPPLTGHGARMSERISLRPGECGKNIPRPLYDPNRKSFPTLVGKPRTKSKAGGSRWSRMGGRGSEPVSGKYRRSPFLDEVSKVDEGLVPPDVARASSSLE